MKKTKTAGDVFNEVFENSRKFVYPEYNANMYYTYLIEFNVALKFNNQGLLSAKTIKEWSGDKTSFKQFMRTAFGKNSKEGFLKFKNQNCPAFLEEKNDIWLSAKLAWEYALHVNIPMRIEYYQTLCQMFEDMADPEIMLDRELTSLQKEGYNMSNVTSITGKSYD